MLLTTVAKKVWERELDIYGAVRKDLIVFGNATKARDARVSDFKEFIDENGVIKAQATRQWPDGASSFAKVEQSPLSGHYYIIKEGTPLPEGLSIKADGRDVGGPNSIGHHTIYNTREMSHSEFNDKFNKVPKTHGGKR